MCLEPTPIFARLGTPAGREAGLVRQTLLLPQRDHWIDANGSARGNPAGHQRARGQSRGDAHDRMPGLVGAEPHALAQGILPREVAPHQGAVHYRYKGRIFTIGIVEESSLQKWDLHDPEVFLADHRIARNGPLALKRTRA